jgi:hypothetical protein
MLNKQIVPKASQFRWCVKLEYFAIGWITKDWAHMFNLYKQVATDVAVLANIRVQHAP